MRLRTMQAGPAMQMPVFLVLFFAPVYVPLSLLQGWIHGVALVNPLTRVLEAARGFVAGTPTEVGAAFAVSLALVVLFSLWAFRGLRKAEAAGCEPQLVTTKERTWRMFPRYVHRPVPRLTVTVCRPTKAGLVNWTVAWVFGPRSPKPSLVLLSVIANA